MNGCQVPNLLTGCTAVLQRMEQPSLSSNIFNLLAGLLCLKTAQVGGQSQWACAAAIHNEILRSRPDLYHELLQPLFVDRKDEIPPGKLPYYQMPVFNFHKVCLSAVELMLDRLHRQI